MPKKTPQITDAESAGSVPRQTKQQVLIDLLSRPEGATLAELSAATGWLSHTVHGAMSGVLKKRLGLEITSEKDETRGRVYRATSPSGLKWHSRRRSAQEAVAS